MFCRSRDLGTKGDINELNMVRPVCLNDGPTTLKCPQLLQRDAVKVDRTVHQKLVHLVGDLERL
jgi:hypothetical protein